MPDGQVSSGGKNGAQQGPPDSGTRQRCFVIAPIGREGSDIRRRSDQILRHLIEPVVIDLGYRPIRADRISDPGLITQQVIEHLMEDELVVADLTGSNPNVYYELAVRHAVRKPCIQIIAADETLPFDVADQRTISVDHRDLDSVEMARMEMRGQIDALSHARQSITNPLSFSVDMQALRKSDDPLENSNAEILNLLQQVISTNHRTYAAIRSNATGDAANNDTKVLRGFIERLSSMGIIPQGEVETLITDYTSSAHDRWVNSLLTRLTPPLGSSHSAGEFHDDAAPT